MKALSYLLTLLFLTNLPFFSFAGDYDKAWTALLKNDKDKAMQLFRKAVRNNDNKDNALSMLILLEAYVGKTYTDKNPAPYNEFQNRDPYLYALWFNDAILGDYSKKKGAQASTLESLVTNASHHGSLQAAANYYKGMILATSRQPQEADKYFKKMGTIGSWAFVGPFDNVNGSGFNKDYGPVSQPSNAKGFLSSNNTMVNWFTPLHITNQGWIFAAPYFAASTAVGYAQTFVYSDKEQETVLCLGGYGSLKAWVNDKLIISQQEPNRTELDAYQATCRLNKGYNRVLLQIGYTNDIDRANFIVRLTDSRFLPLQGITATSVQQSYTPDKSTETPKQLNHFASSYFEERIKKNPLDPALALMLSKVYVRNQEYDEAKQVMNDLYIKNPDNPFIINHYADCLSPQFESTQAAELVEKVKLLDPDNFWVILINEAKLEEEKKYDEAMEQIQRLVSISGNTLLTDMKRANLMVQTGKVDSGVSLIKQMYAREKDNQTVVNVMSVFYKHVLREPEMVVKVLEEFVANNANLEMSKMLSTEYFEKNQVAKGIQVLKDIIEARPFDMETYSPLVQHFYAKQQYDSAIFYLDRMHRMSPYDHNPLADIANCYMQKNNKEKALSYYKRALSLYAGGYDYRRRIRELEQKPDLFKYFPEQDHYGAIKQAFKKPYDTSHSYYYIAEQRNVIVYAEGASEQIYSSSIFINNKSGIDSWKETSIPYNNYYQQVQILKAEVIKRSGSRVPAETSGNEIVFAKLEEGDAIHYSYKISNHGSGRLSREFWDKFYFNSAAPAREVHYNVMIADELPLYYQMLNDDIVKPREGRKENFRTYFWTMKDLAGIRDESYMPKLEDIGKVLHVSTVKSWDVIAEWYSDITRMQSREDFELNAAYQKIFPQGVSGLTDRQKATRIYEFIEHKVAYSSVSFRQSAYVPQRAGKTLQTRLGDCKDMSALFLSFARKAGLDANLVLVSTRNNGLRSVVLPSMDFNHCIIRYKENNEYRYLELTDDQLPFGTLTNTLANAQVLNIPYEYKAGEVIRLLPADRREQVSYVRNVKMVVKDNDLLVNTVLRSNGDLARDLRANYEHKSTEENKDALQESLSGSFKNQVLLNKFEFQHLDNLSDTVIQALDFTVKNDVISVGDFSMLKPVMMEVVATAGIFTNEKRQYPFEYSNYEAADRYKTVIEVEIPAGKSFEQVPSDVKGNYLHMQYSLSYRKAAPNKLMIERVFSTDRTKQLSALDFEKMETFFNEIITAEQKYISFK